MKEPANKAKHQTATTRTTALVTSSIRLWGQTHTCIYTCTHRQRQLICFVSLGVSWGFEAPDRTRPQTVEVALYAPQSSLLNWATCHSSALHSPLSTLSTLDPHPSWQLGSARSYLRTAVPFLMMLGMSCRSQFAHLPLEWPKKASEFKSSCPPNCMQHIALQNKAL